VLGLGNLALDLEGVTLRSLMMISL